MPELFIELFGEEIPARMQGRAADDLSRLVSEALLPLAPSGVRTFFGPRRIALVADVAGEIAATRSTERGPRKSAPEQALAGFLRKHGATREELREEGDFLVLERVRAGVSAATLIARELPGLLRRFPWPKSMRWGGTSHFTWVRPLRRISCLLDGEVVRFDLRDGADDGHGLASANITEGHRFLAPGAVEVSSAADWAKKLRLRNVLVDASERRARIAEQIEKLASAHGLTVVDDPGLLDEVTGLVEWPVALMGRIDDAFMDLPPEVMQVSMRVNQRYFALRDAAGNAAPRFIFVSNIEAADGGRVSVAGNERVLRARFSDARYFWDLDRQRSLESRVAALDGITFHAKLGSQGDRVRRLVNLAGKIAAVVGADVGLAQRAALLAKADLTTGMVGEFPELQGVMGRYYARNDGEVDAVADAIGEHYSPKGPSNGVPSRPVSVAVALADKLDVLAGFFGIGEPPTGSGDPYGLRRAALGILRIIRENELRLGLIDVTNSAVEGALVSLTETIRGRTQLTGFGSSVFGVGRGIVKLAGRQVNQQTSMAIEFLRERLRIQMRSEGARHDVLAAVFGATEDDDVVRLMARTSALTALLDSESGPNLLTAYKRAVNILRIEDKKDGPHDGDINSHLLELPDEHAIAAALDRVEPQVQADLDGERFIDAMAVLATLRAPLDAFFEKTTVNDPNPDLRKNRLRLLSRVRATMNRVADFSKIEGS